MALPIRRGGGLSERLRPSWDPFRDFENMWGEMGRLLEQAAAPAATVGGGQWLPMAEEEETDDAYVVRMELPGVPGENVNIEVDDNELSISGEVSEEHRGKVLSRRTGKFSYRTSLPGTVNADECDADLTEGLLTVRVPKASEGRRHKIELKSKGSKSIEGTQGMQASQESQGAQGSRQAQGSESAQGMHTATETPQSMRGTQGFQEPGRPSGTRTTEGEQGSTGLGLTGDMA
ncbi:Hsp20/alpha crystallin family protein [Streptomyces sp. NPDC016562]|uniref:Hsp20/alpha crystallin family protein n=1 Tax=Streptomyces sp. NPDC016562 TaxID=3364966 RepID=UPI0036FF46B2